MTLGEEQQLAQIPQQEAAKAVALGDAPKRPTKKQREQMTAEQAKAEAQDRELQRAQTDPAAEYLHRVEVGSDMAPAPDADDDDAEDDLPARTRRARLRTEAERAHLRASVGDYTVTPEGDRVRASAVIDGRTVEVLFTIGEFAATADNRDVHIRDRLLEYAGKG
jgi:hypothetical protein